jgi:hypothetical protein
METRIEKLEKAKNIGDKCDWFSMAMSSFGYTYWMVKGQWLILLSDKVEPKHRSNHVGPFSSLREAREWNLNDLKARLPDHYEKLLKTHSIESLLEQK